MTLTSHPVPCAHCGCAAATVEGAYLLVKARHHGRWHETRVSLRDLVRMIRESEGIEVGA